MGKMQIDKEEELLKTLITEIAGVYSIPLGELCTLNHNPGMPEKAKPKRTSFVLVGSSHTRQLREALMEMGAHAEIITMPSYVP